MTSSDLFLCGIGSDNRWEREADDPLRQCVSSLTGHTSTIRCLKVTEGRPILISGGRDSQLRVWDLERGTCLRTLTGHSSSVRCIELAGEQIVSGSYDATCRVCFPSYRAVRKQLSISYLLFLVLGNTDQVLQLWDVNTGVCLQVFRGHMNQIYAVAFDGEKVISGSLDTMVRIWSPVTGYVIVRSKTDRAQYTPCFSYM